MYRFIPLLMLGLCAQFLTACDTRPPADPDSIGRGRVIWIAIDSLRTDHLGFAGYHRDTSPWLDDLAKRSATFTWAVAPSNETVTSVGAYFSGRPYSSLHENQWAKGIPEEIQTLAESLDRAGFDNAFFTANANLKIFPGYEQGFDTMRFVKSPALKYASIEDTINVIDLEYDPSDKLGLVYVHLQDVHHPYRPPDPYGSMFTDGERHKRVDEGNAYLTGTRVRVVGTHPYWSEQHRLNQADIDFMIGLYDGTIRYVDAFLPRLLDQLEFDADKDVLIVSADHGEQLFEQDWWGHFATLTPMETRVPLIISHPAIRPGVYEEPVSLLDLYPTILDWYGHPHPEGLFGVSLLPTLLEGRPPQSTVVAETAPLNGLGAAMVDRNNWYYFATVRNFIKPWELWPREQWLYEYRADPRAANNLIQANASAAGELNERLRATLPRWSPYTPQVLAGTENDVELGEDVLRQVCCDTTATSEVVVRDDRGWNVDLSNVRLAFRAEQLAPHEPYLLEFDYTLDVGSLQLVLRNSASGEKLWDYTFTKPTERTTTFRASVTPRAEDAVLSIDLEPGARADISRPTLRPMNFQSFEPWPRPPEDTTRGVPEALPESDRELLETLGYL